MRRAARRGAIALLPNDPPRTAGAVPPGGSRFPREARLVRRGDFDTVYRSGKRRSSAHFTLFFRPNHLPHTRFGFSIKKALGHAVARNRMRRRTRELVRALRQEIPIGWDIVIHPKSSLVRAEFTALQSELLRALRDATKPLR